jgi:hypothetical protein
MSFNTAKNTSVPGDLYWLKAGTYAGGHTISRPGTSAHPIVFRALPGQQVVLDGAIDVTGAHNWIWGFEIKDPDGSANMPGIQLHAAGVHIINNIVHDIYGDIGIGAWNSGSGQVVYGNIVFKQIANGMNPHNIYTQNNYSQYGYKYFVGNMLLDSWDANSNSYNFHAYTENSHITGYHLEKNIVRRGRFLIGGYGDPVQNEVLRGNYFYDSPILFGWRRPTQIKFENNYLGKASLETEYYWGAGEQQYPQPAPNVYTGNEIYNPSGMLHIRFRTSAYINGNRCDGCPPIRSVDTFNNNKYSSNFSATFHANNQNAGTVNFTTWKSKAAAAGNAFDTNSQLISSAPNKVAVIANEYESGRGHIAIYNWTAANTISVNLSPVVANGANYVIKNPRNNTIVLQGTYNGPVNIPTGGSQFLALLVTSSGGGGPDTVPPVISNIVVSNITTTTVKISWDTNEPSNSQVEYGTAPCPCSKNIPIIPDLVVHHVGIVVGLLPNTTYNYRVKSRDAAGNLGISSNRTFRTLATSAPSDEPNANIEEGISTFEDSAQEDEVANSTVRLYAVSKSRKNGNAVFKVSIPERGNYVVWGRVVSSTDEIVPFQVSADDGPEEIYDLTNNGKSKWQWSRLAARTSMDANDPPVFELTEGDHKFKFKSADPDAKLDMILVTNDVSSVPDDVQ